MTMTAPMRLNAHELRLMLRIVRHLHATGATYRRRDVHTWTLFDGRQVAINSHPALVGVVLRKHGSMHWMDTAADFTQAVDLLVALGFLPQRFSSAYANGSAEAITETWREMARDSVVPGLMESFPTDHQRGYLAAALASQKAVSRAAHTMHERAGR